MMALRIAAASAAFLLPHVHAVKVVKKQYYSAAGCNAADATKYKYEKMVVDECNSWQYAGPRMSYIFECNATHAFETAHLGADCSNASSVDAWVLGTCAQDAEGKWNILTCGEDPDIVVKKYYDVAGCPAAAKHNYSSVANKRGWACANETSKSEQDSLSGGLLIEKVYGSQDCTGAVTHTSNVTCGECLNETEGGLPVFVMLDCTPDATAAGAAGVATSASAKQSAKWPLAAIAVVALVAPGA